MRHVDPGFRASNAVTFNISLSGVSYNTPTKIRNYFHEVLRRLEALPGVQAAAINTDMPLRDDSELFLYVADRPKPTQDKMSWAMLYTVSPRYKDAMGLQLMKGRFISEEDNEKGAPVVVIDEGMARGLFPNEEPVKHTGLVQDATAPIKYQLYMPFDQIPDAFFAELSGGSLSVIVRTAGSPASIGAAVLQTVRDLDRDQPVFGLEPMEQVIEESVATQRFATLLLGMFAGIALLLGSVGIYGVMSYLVMQRTHEMGIRMALGATRNDVLRLVLKYGFTLATAGLALGLIGSVALTRLLVTLLYEISPTDPMTLGAMGALLVGVALLACYLPARRATRVDPMVALRYE